MPTYIYKGICKEHRERMVEAYLASIHPQDPRGRKPLYHIDQRDGEKVREEKKARIKKWHADRKVEHAKDLDILDASVTIVDQLGKPWVFEKGKAVKVPADSIVAKDIENKLNAPFSPFVQWEKVEEAPKGEQKKDPPKPKE